MTSQRTLKQANYVHRGDDDNQDIENLGQCGRPQCDYSKFLKDASGEEYWYCTKLQMPVSCYDSCKYYNDSAWKILMGQWQDIIEQEKKAKEIVSRPQNKGNVFSTLIDFCVLAMLIWYFFFQ